MSKRTCDIVLAGRGGQGVLFLARVLGEAALAQGLPVRVTESHGMAMRGGSVRTTVRVGECLSPLFRRGTGDLLLALDAGEEAGALPLLAPGAERVVNTGFADDIAREAGNPRSANLALLGAASVRPGFPVGQEALEGAILSRSRPRDSERNLDIFRRGRAAAGNQEEG